MKILVVGGAGVLRESPPEHGGLGSFDGVT